MAPLSAAKARYRQAIGLAIYRGILLFVFLLVAFGEFPDHKLSIGLGALVFLQGIAGVGLAMSVAALTSNAVDDMAERKTRHAILLAAQQGREAGGYDFWTIVDDRVAAETGAIREPSIAAQWGLMIWHVATRAVGDFAVLALALVFSG